ncbi:MAG: hypothetical protein JO292_07745, partial [Betaproteobacteria bacterium]|nr:hypothetical protein [Betaproteobacteria bacterium]MBV9361270.1 hypothetical protein [Betaproteobacteria bacterium]
MNGHYSATALLYSEVAWLILLALVLAMVLIRFRPYERNIYLNTLWVFLAGVVGQAAAVALDSFVPGAAAVVNTISRIVSAIALIRLACFAAFRLVLPLMGRDWPRIVEDVVSLALYVIYGFVQLRGAGVDISSLVTTSA